MTSEIIPTAQEIQTLIFEIRGQRVMLDRDLAFLYGVTTGALNQAVKRNIERFPEDFMFQLTDQETANWKSQFVIPNPQSSDKQASNLSQNVIPSSIKMGVRHNPHAFTEHGVIMLASLLRSPIAVEMSIRITRAFVAMRNTLNQIANEQLRLERIEHTVDNLRNEMEDILRDQNDINEDVRLQLDNINDALAQLMAEKSQKLLNDQRPRIGFHVKDDKD